MLFEFDENKEIRLKNLKEFRYFIKDNKDLQEIKKEEFLRILENAHVLISVESNIDNHVCLLFSFNANRSKYPCNHRKLTPRYLLI